MGKICLCGQFSLSQSKAEDGDTRPGSGTSDKSHEETKHGRPSCQAAKADTVIASLLVRNKSCGQTWLTKERRQLEELVLAGNLQNLQSGSQALIKQPRTKWKSTAKI